METIFHSRPRREEAAVDQYLRRQAAEARIAVTNSAAKVRRKAIGLVSPTLWASRHPLATVGAAAIAGAVAARFLLPPSPVQIEKRPDASGSTENKKPPDDKKPRATRRWLGMLVDSLVGAGIGALTQAAMSSITSALMGTDLLEPDCPEASPGDVTGAAAID